MTNLNQSILQAHWLRNSGIRFLLIYALLSFLTLGLFLDVWTWEFFLFHAIAIALFINRSTETLSITEGHLVRRALFPHLLTVLKLNARTVKLDGIISANLDVTYHRNYTPFRFPKKFQGRSFRLVVDYGLLPKTVMLIGPQFDDTSLIQFLKSAIPNLSVATYEINDNPRNSFLRLPTRIGNAPDKVATGTARDFIGESMEMQTDHAEFYAPLSGFLLQGTIPELESGDFSVLPALAFTKEQPKHNRLRLRCIAVLDFKTKNRECAILAEPNLQISDTDIQQAAKHVFHESSELFRA